MKIIAAVLLGTLVAQVSGASWRSWFSDDEEEVQAVEGELCCSVIQNYFKGDMGCTLVCFDA